MDNPQNLKVGQYYGYRDENGNWVTGQYKPNPLTSLQSQMIYDYFNPDQIRRKTASLGSDYLPSFSSDSDFD